MVQRSGEPDLPAWEDGFDQDDATYVVSPFSPGSFFGDRFRIERLIATGGMGNVYEATDLQGNVAVALKVLNKQREPDAETRARFQREAEILASMRHPGIVAIHGFGHAGDGTPWLAMELLGGWTLGDKVRREGPQDVHFLLGVVRAAARALGAAHARGIVHRDLKPENLFLPSAGDYPVKVLDFGLSRFVGSKKLTKTGAVIGTPRYMAPEQIRSAHRSDARVDVYALSVILYEALAGRSPFTASDQGQLLGKIMSGQTEPLSAVRPDLPTELGEVLSRGMAPAPEDRIGSVDELAERFAAALGRTSRFPPSTPPAPRRAVWPWVALAVAVAAGIAVSGGVALGWW